MTRSEIEILIKARNEATQAFTSLGNDVQKIVAASERGATAMEALAAKTKESKPAADAANVAFGMLASTLASKLVTGFSSTIASANRLDSALVGLGATAKAFNVDSSAAQAAAQKLASDGLMPVADAAAGLKNLLAAGFGLDQATTLMNRFKDSAAFGRQGTLEFGQAIVGATEGIKNGNSALVDNAGVTKNLSVILTEAGFSAQDLAKASSDVSVRTALFNGILKETNPQLGNTALLLETAAGKQAQFNAAVETTSSQLGKGLQPILGDLLGIIRPVIEITGQHADTVVRLGVVVAAIIAPMALMKATAALGIPSFAGLATATKAAGLAMATTAVETGSLRATLATLGTQAGITAANLGVLGTAAAVAGSAFAGWQIGRLIADLTGADAAMQKLGETLIFTNDRAEVAASKQDVISKAIRSGADAQISYLDAVKYNIDIDNIRLAQFDKSAAAQERATKSEAELGRISQAQATDRLALIKAEQAGVDIRTKLATAGNVVAQAEAAFQTQVKSTGFTVQELTANLANNEGNFMLWAKAIDLTDDTIKRLKASLETSTKAHKDHEAAQKKTEQAAKAMRDALEALGVVTLPGVNLKLKELDAQVKAATDAGVPFTNVVRAIWPELQKLAEQAKASGVGLDVVKAKMKSFEDQGFLLQPTKSLVTFAQTMPVVTSSSAAMFAEMRKGEANQRKLNEAFDAFGLKTPGQLRAASDAAVKNFQILKDSGTASTVQLRIAYQAMIDAQKDATGELPSIWSSVIPKIQGTIETLSTAINGTFAQMLLGAKGFKEGFVDIWESLKKSVLNILNSILSTFLNAFLKGITGALAGQSGAWSQAFSGIAGGGRGGVNWAGLLTKGGGTAATAGSLAGGGGALLPASGFVGYAGTAGTAAGATGATAGTGGAAAGGGLATGTVLGIAGGAAAGGFVGWKVGRATGSTAKGVAAGAATGAAVGSIGGPVGAGIGAGVGALAGWWGARKANKEADKEMNAIREKLLATFGDMEKLRQAASVVGVNIDEAFNKKGKKGVEAFNKIIGDFEGKFNDLDAATQRYGVTLDEIQGKNPIDEWQTQVDTLVKDYGVLTSNGLSAETTIKKMAPAFNQVLMAALDSGKKLPASMEPMLQQMLKLGLVTEDVQRRLLGMTDGVTVDFKAMQDKAQQYGIDLNSLGGKFQSARLGETARAIFDDFTMLTQAGADVGGVLFGMKDEISDLVSQSLKFGTEIPENMRPLIEELSRTGQLVDENGDKIEGLGNLKFAEPLAAGFDKVVQAIKDLTGVLTGDLPKATADGVGKANDILEKWRPNGKTVPIEFDFPEDGPSSVWNPNYGPNGPRGGVEDNGLPGAASGIFATGDKGVATWFGEGNEPEVGGPASFFERIFTKLGVGNGNGNDQAPVFNISITAMSASDVKTTVETQVIPAMLDAWRTNRRGSLTDARALLGA